MSVWPLFGLAGLLFAEVLGVRGVGDVRGCCKRVFRAKGSFLSQNHLVCADPFFFPFIHVSFALNSLFFLFHSVSCHLPALHPPQTLLFRNRHTQPTRTTPPYLKNRTDTRDSRNTRRGFFRNPVGKSGVHKGPESLKSKQTFNKSGSPFPGPSSSAVSPSSPPLSTATKNVVHIPRPEAPGCPPRRRGR